MAPDNSELVLIRHGETEWSRTRHHTGRTDIPLTEHGRQQAADIATAVAAFEFAHVFASPLSRAWETAQLIGLDPTADADLMEWDYGIYEGKTTAEIRETIPGWSVWTHPITNGESIGDIGARTDQFIARALDFHGTVAVVAHSHLLRILAARWIELPPLEGRRLTLDTTTVSVLGWERENRVITRWNDPCQPGR